MSKVSFCVFFLYHLFLLRSTLFVVSDHNIWLCWCYQYLWKEFQFTSNERYSFYICALPRRIKDIFPILPTPPSIPTPVVDTIQKEEKKKVTLEDTIESEKMEQTYADVVTANINRHMCENHTCDNQCKCHRTWEICFLIL